jgi:hypothetical protein
MFILTLLISVRTGRNVLDELGKRKVVKDIC